MLILQIRNDKMYIKRSDVAHEDIAIKSFVLLDEFMRLNRREFSKKLK